jgi:hypothetical protein
MDSIRIKSMRPHLFCLLSSVCCLLLNSCTALGAIAGKVMGPDKVVPEYVPPATEPLLVLAEGIGERGGDLEPVADELARLVSEDLRRHKVAPIVPEDKLIELRSARATEYPGMTVMQIGKACGAKQVICVDLKEADLTELPGSDVMQGHVWARVKIVDVETGRTRWPSSGDGHELRTPTEYIRDNARGTPLAMREQMIQDLAGAIARLFYTYEPENNPTPGA